MIWKQKTIKKKVSEQAAPKVVILTIYSAAN